MKKSMLFLVLLLLTFTTSLQAQWSQISTVQTTRLTAVNFFDSNTGVVAGYGGIWRSTNGGVNWIQVLTGPNLNSLSFNSNAGIAVGDSGKIYKSTDNGSSWQQLASGTTSNLNSVSFATANFAYVVGQNGIFLRTFNSGSTWSISSAFTQDLYFVLALPSGTGFALGALTSEYYTVTANGGTNWLGILNTTGGYHLYSGSILSGQNICVCVGNNGRIRRTTDWGLTWVLPVSNTTNNLNSIFFINTNTGWLCGQNGLIESSTNGGLNWSQQSSSTTNYLRALSFINSSTGWAVGENGIVLNIGLPVGIKQTNPELPQKFNIYQNYPNPFNPTTRINYEIPIDSKVKLVVYDILGREVMKLVNNEFKKMGRYAVDFDGTNLASGVYFYRIEAGDFVQSRKMVLIK